MSFADVEARANASIFAKLANARAVFTPNVGDPVDFPIVFDAAGGLVDPNGVVTEAPHFLMQPSVLPGLAQDVVLAIRADVPDSVPANYKVRTVAPLDEGGRQRVILSRA